MCNATDSRSERTIPAPTTLHHARSALLNALTELEHVAWEQSMGGPGGAPNIGRAQSWVDRAWAILATGKVPEFPTPTISTIKCEGGTAYVKGATIADPAPFVKLGQGAYETRIMPTGAKPC